MRTFSQKREPGLKERSASSTKPSRAFPGQSRDTNAILHLQHSIGNHAVQRLLQSSTAGTSAAHDENTHGQTGSPSKASIARITEMAVNSPGEALPFSAQIRASFGRHEVPAIAHTNASATAAATGISATAFTKGRHIVFADRPSLPVVAHEAAHVVQQMSGVRIPGGIGVNGDVHERHAEAVAKRVVAGRSCEDLLDAYGDTRGNRGSTSPVIQRLDQSLPYVGPVLSYMTPMNQLTRLALPGLSPKQKSLLDGIFGNSLATSLIRLNPNSLLASGNCFRVTGNIINMPESSISDYYLIHEAAHVWQSQNSVFGVDYAASALKNMAIAQVLGGDWQKAYDYSKVEKHKIPWRYWNAEQQANWIRDNKRLPTTWMIQAALPDFNVIESTGL